MSESGLHNEEPTPPATAGELLRRTRLDQGLNLQGVASYLHLTPRQVEALEAGRYEELPGEVYIRGFLKNYARFLGVNPNQVLALYQRGESVGTRYARKIAMKSEGPLIENSWLTVVWALTLMLFVAAIVLVFYKRHDNLPQIDKLVFQQLSRAADSGAGQARVAPGVSSALAASAATAPIISDFENRAGGVSLADPNPAPAVSSPPEHMDQLHFTYTGKVWVEVKDAKGNTLLKRIAREGDENRVQGKAPFGVTLGNALAAQITLDGVPVQVPAKRPNQVVFFTVAETASAPAGHKH